MVSNKCSRKSRKDNPSTQSIVSTRHRMKTNKTRRLKSWVTWSSQETENGMSVNTCAREG
jgi:hypothetical protein